MEALAVVVQAVDVLDHFTLEVEDLEGLTVERAAQGEELLHESDDLAALGLHVHLTGQAPVEHSSMAWPTAGAAAIS